MKTTELKSLLILWHRQGLFQGDLNRVQQHCLAWNLNQDTEQKLDLLKVQTLASNPEVYKAIFEPLADPDGGGEWKTLNPEEEAELLAEFERFQAQQDQL